MAVMVLVVMMVVESALLHACRRGNQLSGRKGAILVREPQADFRHIPQFPSHDPSQDPPPPRHTCTRLPPPPLPPCSLPPARRTTARTPGPGT